MGEERRVLDHPQLVAWERDLWFTGETQPESSLSLREMENKVKRGREGGREGGRVRKKKVCS